MLHSSILSTFIKIYIFEWPFYTGFTVSYFSTGCFDLQGMGPLMNPADFMPEMKKESSREKERKEEEKKIEGKYSKTCLKRPLKIRPKNRFSRLIIA